MTKKDKLKIVNEICDKYSTGKYTIESCCQNAAISYESFNNWKKANTEIAELYKKASEEKRSNHRKELVELALTALQKKLSFAKYKEIRIETDSTGSITKKIETERTMIPAPADIAIVLNLFYYETDNRQITSVTFDL